MRRAKLSRARNSDEKRAQQEKIADAEEQLKAAQSAQAALEEYVKKFPQEPVGTMTSLQRKTASMMSRRTRRRLWLPAAGIVSG